MPSIMPPRPDYAEQERRRFEHLPNFPLNCTSWEQFQKRMQGEEGTLFALRLMSMPQSREMVISFRGMKDDPLFFGRYGRRHDERIGRACFGYFLVQEGDKKVRRLKILDGFSKEDLQLSPESQEEMLTQMSQPLFRRSKISQVLEGDEAKEELASWLIGQVGYNDEEDGLDKESAARLKMIRFIMRQVFPHGVGTTEKITELLTRIDLQLGRYIKQLEERVRIFESDIALLKEEISTLE